MVKTRPKTGFFRIALLFQYLHDRQHTDYLLFATKGCNRMKVPT